jgi:acetamidase/formamidase
MKQQHCSTVTAWSLAMLSTAAIAQGNVIPLTSVPANVVRGHIPSDRAPVLKIKSGQTVAIDTISHQGISTPEGAVAFFGKGGVRAEDVLPDAIAVQTEIKIPQGGGTHVLTGPIYVEGAEPGDMLEVRVINIELRVPYGVNASNKGTGVLPEQLNAPMFRVIHLDTKRNVALFAPEIEVPLAPFMGIMAVAPPPGDGSMVSSRPPGMFGGNLDLKQLTRGASLFLPVYNAGALFYTGDGHSTQGDGEVDGTAIETSLKPTLQFIVHKGKGRGMVAPRAETATHYIAIGMDRDLNLALKNAVQEAANFLTQEKGLDAGGAYALASIAVDFRVAEAVNLVQVVYGMIPKAVFKLKQDFWFKP